MNGAVPCTSADLVEARRAVVAIFRDRLGYDDPLVNLTLAHLEAVAIENGAARERQANQP
jgi:hypothetical protein